MVFLSSVYMNITFGCFLYNLFLLIESTDVLFYNLFIWIESMDVLFYNLFIWIESMDVLFIICLCKCYLYCLLVWMDSVNVCFIVLYEWNLCMFAMSFVYINGIFGCFLRCLLLRIEYVNDFFIVVYMNGICGCFYNLFISVKVFVSLLIDMNRKYVRFLYCLSKWIEFVNIFLIVCLYIWWWSRYCVRGLGEYRAKLCCFFQIQNLCFDLLLSLSFICIKTFSFCLYYSHSN